jgi:SAM-dependent methyltransferase
MTFKSMPIVPYVHDTKVHNFSAAEVVLPYVFTQFGKPESVVDIGCGLGTWLTVAQQLGVKIILGIDGDYVVKDSLTIENQYFISHDLTQPFAFEKKFNLAICLEVAEHLPEEAALNLIQTLTNASNLLLFSAALPNQGGQNHINEQPFSYWFKRFEAVGFFPIDALRPHFWQNGKVEWWYRQNMFILTNDTVLLRRFEPSQTINTYIHPELYVSKIQQIKHLEHRLFQPTLKEAVKNLLFVFVREIRKIFNR